MAQEAGFNVIVIGAGKDTVYGLIQQSSDANGARFNRSTPRPRVKAGRLQQVTRPRYLEG